MSGGQHQLEHWPTENIPRCVDRVNGAEVLAWRDTGSTTCVVKTELVRPEQMKGSYELCMLPDGIVKRFPIVTKVMLRSCPWKTGLHLTEN